MFDNTYLDLVKKKFELLSTIEKPNYTKQKQTILDSKLTNQDVGGLDFIYSSIKENFKLNAVDTIYKYVKSNVYGDRNQDLPEVSEIVSATVTKTAYKYSKGNINILDPSAYVVNIKWSYKKSSSYQTSSKITLVHEKEDLLSIIKVQ